MRLLWVRANGRFEAALKAADLILHSGGFGVIVLDLCEAPAAELGTAFLFLTGIVFAERWTITPGRFIVASHVPLAKSLCTASARDAPRRNSVDGVYSFI